MSEEVHKEELHQLRLMWDRLKHEWDETQSIDFQPPASLMDASAGVLDMMLKKAQRDMSPSCFEFVTMYGQMMFTYGQFSHRNGLYRENLTPRELITNEDIDKLLGRN